jgi:hypothetical protein
MTKRKRFSRERALSRCYYSANPCIQPLTNCSEDREPGQSELGSKSEDSILSETPSSSAASRFYATPDLAGDYYEGLVLSKTQRQDTAMGYSRRVVTGYHPTHAEGQGSCYESEDQIRRRLRFHHSASPEVASGSEQTEDPIVTQTTSFPTIPSLYEAPGGYKHDELARPCNQQQSVGHSRSVSLSAS